jgi:hypothetical protein
LTTYRKRPLPRTPQREKRLGGIAFFGETDARMQAGGTKADAEVTEGLVPQEHPEGFLVSQRNRKLSGQALGWFKTVAGFPTRYRGVEKNPLGGPYNAKAPGRPGLWA